MAVWYRGTVVLPAAYSVAIWYSGQLYFLQLTVWQFGIADRFMQLRFWQFGIAGMLYFLQFTVWQFGITDRFISCSLQCGSSVLRTALLPATYSVTVRYSGPLYFLQLTV